MTRLVLAALFLSVVALAARCPADLAVRPPEFDSEYQFPATSAPPPRASIYRYIDLVVLVVALSVASYLALAKRSRRGLFVLMLFSLLYFGFWRGGCVCPIGAIQNVAAGLFNPAYAVPLTVLAVFLLPLIFALFFGRAFCAAVCPLGAVQDLVAVRPIKVAGWLEHSLGLLAWVYLAAAVLLAALGSTFLICRIDPFVAIFRLLPIGQWVAGVSHQNAPPGGVLGISGRFDLLLLAGLFLLIGVFVARPYCRFLCPYGAILRVLSSLSRWHVTITPDECIQCRLCEQACPYNAIRKPTGEQSATSRPVGVRRLAILIVLLPMLVALGGIAGRAVSGQLARMDYTVSLAERIRLEETGRVEGRTDASEAFIATGRTNADLYDQAMQIEHAYGIGSILMGAFIGLVIGLKLIGLSVHRTRADYVPNRAACLSCGRCWSFCPIDQRERSQSLLSDSGEVGQS